MHAAARCRSPVDDRDQMAHRMMYIRSACTETATAEFQLSPCSNLQSS